MGKLLITGGAGFIGSALARNALERGWDIRIVDSALVSNQSSIEQLKSSGVEIITGDIRDHQLMKLAVDGCDAVVHLAAQVSVPISIINPEETMDVNVKGTSGVIQLCHEFGIERLVMASSAAVYGDCENFPLKEEEAGQTLSPYAHSKWTNEKQIIEARDMGLKAAVLRFFNVYGPGQSPEGSYAAVIPTFIDQMINGMSPKINGDGFQTRDFVHVDDVSVAILALIEGDWKAQNYHAFNVATQTETSLNDLVKIINKAIRNIRSDHEPIQPKYGPMRDGDIRHSFANIERMRTTYGWNPEISFETGINEMVREKINNAE